MLSDEDVYKYLMNDNNLEVAMEMSKFVERLKNTLHESFWTKFNEHIIRKLDEEGLRSTWEYKPKLRSGAFRDEWGLNSLSTVSKGEGYPSKLFVFFGHTSRESDYQLYWGVHWTKKPPVNFQNPELTKLKVILDRHQMHDAWELSVLIGYCDEKIYDAGFLRSMNDQPDDCVKQLVDKFWQLFLEVKPSIETINAAVNNT